jgi:hypothetical protein
MSEDPAVRAQMVGLLVELVLEVLDDEDRAGTAAEGERLVANATRESGRQ